MESFLQNRPSVGTTHRYTLRSANEPGFQPLLRPTAPGEKEASLGANNPAGVPSSPEESEPQIELVESNGCVDRILITCSCGKRIELQCEY